MKNVCDVAKNVAHETMQDAASEIKGDDEGITNTAVSVDGSWQKRGYSSFNGEKATILMYEKLQMKPGSYTLLGCSTLNRKRLSRSEYRNKPVVKKRRTVLRAKIRKGEDSQLEKEGTVYKSGAFSQ